MSAHSLKGWIIQVDSELENASPRMEALWSSRSIYKVPEGFGNPNRKEAYKPQVVSFGPYHHGKPQLKQVEEHKQRVLCSFLRRARKHTSDCVNAVKRVVPQLEDSYDELDEKWKESWEFLQMMILDGCFMLEIFRSRDSRYSNEYGLKDPIFSKHAMLCKLPRIKRDMLMIENQLPLLLLKTLVDFEMVSPQNDEFINRMVMKFFEPQSSFLNMGRRLHVLDVVRQSMLQNRMRQDTSMERIMGPQTSYPSLPEATLMGQSSRSQTHNRNTHQNNSMWQKLRQKIYKRFSSPPLSEREVIRPATELREAGIRFKSSGTQDLKTIEFKNHCIPLPGTLILPEIEVDDATESKFLNLIAFEHLHAGVSTEVSSYVSFMDNLIDTEKDVSLLTRKNILKNYVGTDKAVADLFNGLAYDVSIDHESRLWTVHKDVTVYCHNRYHQWLYDCWHLYFRSPWSCISVVGAVCLLVLTIIQVAYAVLEYKKP